METLDSARVTRGEGVLGDYRGALAAQKPGRKRQVSLIERACWEAALAAIDGSLDCHHSRRNLVLEGLRVPRERIGASLIIEITGECEPCERMEALIPGLFAAMTPDWRGGFVGRVEQDGEIALDNEIRIL